MIRGLIFDINGTVSDILTDEGHDELWRTLGNFLEYQGIFIAPAELREHYFELNRLQRKRSGEEFPEFDVVRLFAELLEKLATKDFYALSPSKREKLPVVFAEIFRAASRFQLKRYPEVRRTLRKLRENYRLAALSDGQSLWALPEIRSVGLEGFFDPVIISSDLGYRKPDERMFTGMLKALDMKPEEVIFIGNDMFRDVYGAQRVGIRTVFFLSNQGEQKMADVRPDYIIYHFNELPEAVRFLEERDRAAQ